MQELSRAEFYGWDGSPGFWDYRDGEHAAWIYPTQKGKTHSIWQTIQATRKQRPWLRPVTLMPKALSPSTHRWGEALGFREVAEWPPLPRLGQKPPGYLVWPKHRKDLPVAEDRAQVAAVLRKALHDNFVKGKCILVADDLHLLSSTLGLNAELEEFWTAGAEGGAALWGANQKPSGTATGPGISTYFYSASTHFFLGRDTDERNVRRFAEIGGGIDPREIAHIVRNLKLYRIGDKTISQQLYIDARIPAKALIGPLWTLRNARSAGPASHANGQSPARSAGRSRAGRARASSTKAA